MYGLLCSEPCPPCLLPAVCDSGVAGSGLCLAPVNPFPGIRTMLAGCSIEDLHWYGVASSDSSIVDIAAGLVPSASFSLNYTGRQFLEPEPLALGDGRSHTFSHSGLNYSSKGTGATVYTRPGGDGRASFLSSCREHFLLLHVSSSLGLPATEPRGVIRSTCPSDRVVRDGEHGENYGLHDGGILLRALPGNPTLSRLGSVTSTAAYDALSAQHFPHCSDPSCVLSSLTFTLASFSSRLQSSFLVHGSLNSDNILLTGDLVDLTVAAFLPSYDLEYSPSRVDSERVYSYGNQTEAVLR